MNTMNIIEEKLMMYIKEDMGLGDITTETVLGDHLGSIYSGKIIAKEDCTVAGLDVIKYLFDMLGCETDTLVDDGSTVKSGSDVALVRGPVEAIFLGERTGLNILSRMSGVATEAQRCLTSARAVNSSVKIAATRKTTPGFGIFEKLAVLIADCDTHRMNLSEEVLIKDNHIKVAGGPIQALKAARENCSFTKKIEIEVENLQDAVECAMAGADIVMLDNFDPDAAAEAYKAVKEASPNTLVEVSGNITPDNVADYAASADIISMGYLTHSYKSINFSLELIQPEE